MIKRRLILGIGTVLLVIGLAGLGLVQTGVIYPPVSAGAISLSQVKSPEPAAGGGEKSKGPIEQTAADRAGSPALSPQPGGKLETSASASVDVQAPARQMFEKPVPVPQLKKGGGGYPIPQPGSEVQTPRLAKKLGQAHIKTPDRQPASKRYVRKSEPMRYARKAPEAQRAGRHKGPVVIRFRFDPDHNDRLNVARVHLGDKIRVKVQRVGPVNRRVYFTFSRDPDSLQGAVLELKTMYSFEAPSYRHDRGYYVIEVKIYPDNRWNIMPRSFV